MSVNWDEVNQALVPLKDYEDLSRRFQISFAYPFVREVFNFTLPRLLDQTQKLLGGDARGRYAGYLAELVGTLTGLIQARVPDVLDLVANTATPHKLESFTKQRGLDALDLVHLLKYLVYWFIPGEKYLSGLIRDDPILKDAVMVLGNLGLRTNLQLLQQGITPDGRQALADSSGLPGSVINKLVNIADFSRLPWSSKATIANILGAGYPSLAALANADPEKLYDDFFAFGQSIGKNLKLGNEIENSYRIANIVPAVVQEQHA
jgi:hypothetical protein